MDLDQALQTFIVESRELLDDVETALLAIERKWPGEDVRGVRTPGSAASPPPPRGRPGGDEHRIP